MCHHYESDSTPERELTYEPEDEVNEAEADLDEEHESRDEVDPAVPPADD